MSIVENARVCPTSLYALTWGLWDQGSWNGWKTYMEFYMGCNGKCLMVYWILLSSPPERDWFNTKLRDHATSEVQNLLIDYKKVFRSAHMNRMLSEILQLRARLCTSLCYTWRPVTTQNLISINEGTAFGWVSRAITVSWHGLWMGLKSLHNFMLPLATLQSGARST